MSKDDLLKNLSGVSLGIVGVAVCVGLLFTSHLEEKRRNLILKNSFCPVERSVKVWSVYEIFPPKVPRKIAVVIDATDRIPDRQQREIDSWFRSEFERSLDRFTKVAIYQLDEGISDEAPEFEKCAPPLEANPWIENPQIVRNTFKKEFQIGLLDVVKSLASREQKNFSPILEMVEKIFDSYDEMILVSDLMHHTSGYSLYKGSENSHDYGDFSRTPYAATIKNNRWGKTLTVIYMIREKLKPKQNKTLREFWREHMESNGGEFVRVKTLSTIVE